MNKIDFLQKLGYKIRILRDKKQLSQETLADIAGLDRGHIGTIERGKIETKIYTLKQIADALEVDITELFNFTI